MRTVLLSVFGSVLLLSAPALALTISATVVGDPGSAFPSPLYGQMISTYEMAKVDATITLPSEPTGDSWDKAAYSVAISTSYFEKPERSDSQATSPSSQRVLEWSEGA